MAVKLKDIARRTGFSQMTVSRALRGIGRVKTATREQIIAVARELGYEKLNHVMMPRSIRSGKADHVLSLLLPVIGDAEKIFSSGLSRKFLDGLEGRLAEIGGKLKIASCRNLDDMQREFSRRGVHGLVLRQWLPSAWIKKLRAQGPVLYTAAYDFQPGVDCVYYNEHRSATMILSHLMANGHRHVAWFGIIDHHSRDGIPDEHFDAALPADRRSTSIHGPRYAAWANLALCQPSEQRQLMLLLERDWQKHELDEVVERGLAQILDHRPRPTAVIVPSDVMGIALAKAVRKRRLKVPKDLSIVSYGDSPEARQHDPPLTTVRLPMRLIGQLVPELIERRIAKRDAIPISVQLETTLVTGASVHQLTKGKAATRDPYLPSAISS